MKLNTHFTFSSFQLALSPPLGLKRIFCQQLQMSLNINYMSDVLQWANCFGYDSFTEIIHRDSKRQETDGQANNK